MYLGIYILRNYIVLFDIVAHAVWLISWYNILKSDLK